MNKIPKMNIKQTIKPNSVKMRVDETYRRITREKFVIRGNTTIRTLDSTTSFLPIVERWALLLTEKYSNFKYVCMKVQGIVVELKPAQLPILLFFISLKIPIFCI